MLQASIDKFRGLGLGDQVARHARLTPDAAAFVFMGKRLSYANLDRNVSALAAGLGTRGVDSGDRVAVLMTNRLELVESYLAVCRLGAVCVPINFRLVPPEI